MKSVLSQIKVDSKMSDKMAAVDQEFKDFLGTLAYRKVFGTSSQATFSPLDAVVSFEQRGIQQVREVSTSEMLNNGDALKKLLANMLAQCKPGQLSDDDMDQLSGINGREIAQAAL